MNEIINQVLTVVIQAVALILSAAVAYYVPVLFRAINKKLHLEIGVAEEKKFEAVALDAVHAVEQAATTMVREQAGAPSGVAKKALAAASIAEELKAVGIKKTTAQVDNKIEAVISKSGVALPDCKKLIT